MAGRSQSAQKGRQTKSSYLYVPSQLVVRGTLQAYLTVVPGWERCYSKSFVSSIGATGCGIGQIGRIQSSRNSYVRTAHPCLNCKCSCPSPFTLSRYSMYSVAHCRRSLMRLSKAKLESLWTTFSPLTLLSSRLLSDSLDTACTQIC